MKKCGSTKLSLLEGLRIQGEANCATVERLEQHLRYRVPQLNANYKKSEQNPYLKAEPPYKMYYILVEQAARIKDAESNGTKISANPLSTRLLGVGCSV